jgi:hypothetical protein
MKRRWGTIGTAVVAVVALVVALLGLVTEPAGLDVGPQSLSGYALRLEDGTGSEIFSVSDAGNVDAAGTLSSDGASTLASATINGDITLENDETISNSDDGVVQVGGFLALTEGAVVEVSAAGTITPLAAFQPITSSAVITNAVLADGSVAGQVLVLVNENASDDITVLESGSNLDAGGDVALTGGAVDAVTLMWTGATWSRLSFEDN